MSDVWLAGPSIALSKWLISLSLTAPAAFVNGDSIDGLVHEIEAAAKLAGIDLGTTTAVGGESDIDAIFINFHYADHLHEQSLRTFNTRIPVLATTEAAAIIREWKHFDTVVTTKDFDPADTDWSKLHPARRFPTG